MIPHNKPSLSVEEEEAAVRVIKSGQVSQGIEVELFEDEFCNFIGLPKGHAVAVSSGSAALYMSLWALDVRDKEVQYPTYVCSALKHAVSLIGGKSLQVDVEKDSPNIMINNASLEGKVSIIPHMFGIPIDLSKFTKYQIIEDCAQSLGAKVNNSYVGLQGNAAIFSFYATKLITTGGQGGMLISKNKETVDAVKDYREFDYRKDTKNRFNFQMTEIQAAIGREQLKKFPNFVKRREEIFSRYVDETELEFMTSDKLNIIPVRYRAIAFHNEVIRFMKYLKESGVETKIPIEDWELLGEKSLYENALSLTKKTISLPIYPSLKDEQVDEIIAAIKKYPQK
jgi:perosamine synthetase